MMQLDKESAVPAGGEHNLLKNRVFLLAGGEVDFVPSCRQPRFPEIQNGLPLSRQQGFLFSCTAALVVCSGSVAQSDWQRAAPVNCADLDQVYSAIILALIIIASMARIPTSSDTFALIGMGLLQQLHSFACTDRRLFSNITALIDMRALVPLALNGAGLLLHSFACTD
eukprot:1158371-Pelagomonas_calceolata.AAC.7